MIHNLSHINLKATPSLQTKLGLEVEVSKLSIDTIHDQRKSRAHKNAYTVNYHGRTEMLKWWQENKTHQERILTENTGIFHG